MKSWMCAMVVVVAGLLAGPATAHADRKVFLNGVDLSDVELHSRVFSNAEVRFDKKGNVHIEVKGLQVEKRDADDDTDRQPIGGSGRYYVISTHPGKGYGLDFPIEVLVNGKVATRLAPQKGTIAADVTPYMVKGKNVVKLRSDGGKAVSAKRSKAWDIVMGAGKKSKGSVTLSETLLEYRRVGSEEGSVRATYRLEVK